MSPSREPEPWRETLVIQNPLAECGGCGFAATLDGAWSVEGGRLVFRALLNPLTRRGPSIGGCGEGRHNDTAEPVEFKRVIAHGKPLTDEEFATLKATAESPEAWDEETGR